MILYKVSKLTGSTAIEIDEFKNKLSQKTRKKKGWLLPSISFSWTGISFAIEFSRGIYLTRLPYTVAKLGGHEHLTVPHSNQKTTCSLKQYAH